MKERRDPERSRLAWLCAGLVLAAVIGPGGAWAGDEIPSFFIETITVETERLSPDIVLSESLLQQGREYTESDLREAVHRVNRLPFVLLAEFSLRKGSERGRYELAIQVYETRRWFSQLAFGLALNDSVDRFRANRFGDGFLRSADGDNVDALIGRRFAVGQRGLLFASFGTDAGLFAVGYQRYGLWNRNVLFSLTLGGEDDGVASSRTLRAQLGIPIRGDHALRLLAAHSRHDFDDFLLGDSETRETELEIAWVFNSLDDPVLPREGTLFELGLAGARLEDWELLSLDGGLRWEETLERRSAVVASASRYWPVGVRQSVSAGVGGFIGDRTSIDRKWQGEATAGHQVFLLRNQEPGKWRELRFETRLSVFRQEYGDELTSRGLPGAENSWALRTGITYRNGWGLFAFFLEHAERSFE